MQVRFLGAARDFSPRVNFQCRLSYGVCTPLCAIACIYICAHIKDPVVHVRGWWIMESLKCPACTVGWVAQLCRSWLSLGKATRISHGRNPIGTTTGAAFFSSPPNITRHYLCDFLWLVSCSAVIFHRGLEWAQSGQYEVDFAWFQLHFIEEAETSCSRRVREQERGGGGGGGRWLGGRGCFFGHPNVGFRRSEKVLASWLANHCLTLQVTSSFI